MPVRSCWLKVLFSYFISLVILLFISSIYCWERDDKISNYNFPFSSVDFVFILFCCFMYFEALLICAWCTFGIVKYFGKLTLSLLGNAIFVSDNFFCSDVYFAWYSYTRIVSVSEYAVCAWNTHFFYHYLTFNTPTSLYFKWFFWNSPGTAYG